MVVTISQHVQQDTLVGLVTAESSTRQLTSALDPLTIWLSSFRPLIVPYGDEAAALLADRSRLARRLEDSCHAEPGDAAIAYSLAELASDTCPSATTHGLPHSLAIFLDPVALGSPSFHLAFECRILVRDSEQSLSSDEKALPTAEAACWTDTAASTCTGHSSVDQQRRRHGSPRHNHQATSQACTESLWICQSGRRRRAQGPATNPAHRARIHDRLVTSTRTSCVTRMDWHSPQQEPTSTAATLHSVSLGPIAHHGRIDRDDHHQAQ